MSGQRLRVRQPTPDAILEPLMPLAEQLIPYLGEVWDTLDQFRRQGRRVLFEGAQGVMFEADQGHILL